MADLSSFKNKFNSFQKYFQIIINNKIRYKYKVFRQTYPFLIIFKLISNSKYFFLFCFVSRISNFFPEKANETVMDLVFVPEQLKKAWFRFKTDQKHEKGSAMSITEKKLKSDPAFLKHLSVSLTCF